MLKAFLYNLRKPSGFIGSLLCRGMNLAHGPMAREVLGHFTITPGMRTLDVGCGGGHVLRMMLERGAEAAGVDYSATSVARASSKVAAYSACGKARVDVASVEALPYENERFDLVTAFETVYFWPEIENAFTEIARVLRPGGRFVIAVAVWKEGGTINCPAFFLKNLEMTPYAPEELETLLLGAGFSSVRTIRAPNNKWLAVHGEKQAKTEP